MSVFTPVINLTPFDPAHHDPRTWIHIFTKEVFVFARREMALYFHDQWGLLDKEKCRDNTPRLMWRILGTLNVHALTHDHNLRGSGSDTTTATTTASPDPTTSHEYRKHGQFSVTTQAYIREVCSAANRLLDPLSKPLTGTSDCTLQELTDYLIEKYATLNTNDVYKLMDQHTQTLIPADPQVFERDYVTVLNQIADQLETNGYPLSEHQQMKVLTDQTKRAHPALLKGLQRYREKLARDNAEKDTNAATKKEKFKEATTSIVAYLATLQLDVEPPSAHHAATKDITALTAQVAQLQAQLKKTQQKAERVPDERPIQYCFKCGHNRTHPSAECGIMKRATSEFTPAMRAATAPCTLDGREGSTRNKENK
jgi:hypothetical protein